MNIQPNSITHLILQKHSRTQFQNTSMELFHPHDTVKWRRFNIPM